MVVKKNCCKLKNQSKQKPIKKLHQALKLWERIFETYDRRRDKKQDESEGEDDSQPAGLKKNSVVAVEINPSAKAISSSHQSFMVGDLVWTKTARRPFWPGMITYDPHQGVHTKMGHEKHLYHVNFFGQQVLRGWIGTLKPFEGVHKFEEDARKIIDQSSLKGSRKKRLIEYYSLDIPKLLADSFAQAKLEVNAASKMNWRKRLEEFVRKFMLTQEGYPLNEYSSESGSDEMKSESDGSDTSSEVNLLEEGICFVCEKPGIVLSCNGKCKRSFHQDCLGLYEIPLSFKCDECTLAKHLCYICKTYGDVLECSLPNCGKFYHRNCLQFSKLPNALCNGSLVCPQHLCLTCHYKDDDENLSKKKLLKCIRCPVAYHTGKFCLCAGSKVLDSSRFICAVHFKKNNEPNVSSCAICYEEDAEVHCESCPEAYHSACLGLEEKPRDSFYCRNCQSTKPIIVNDFLGVKYANCSWPATVRDPNFVPKRLKSLHRDGDFVVYIFGLHQYVLTRREFLCRIEFYNISKKYEMKFYSGLVEAGIFIIDKIISKVVQKSSTTEQEKEQPRPCKPEQPPMYKKIRCNKYVNMNPVSYKSTIENTCDCSQMNACGSDCLNRIVNIECDSKTCPAGSSCQNQSFQKRNWIPCAVFKTEDRGWGLRTLKNIQKGDFVIEHVGEVINTVEYNKRRKRMAKENCKDLYFLALGNGHFIDSRIKGNSARFVNHSCKPNCETQKWVVKGEPRLGIFALVDIPADSELTISYNYDAPGKNKTICLCRSQKCRGFIDKLKDKDAW